MSVVVMARVRGRGRDPGGSAGSAESWLETARPKLVADGIQLLLGSGPDRIGRPGRVLGLDLPQRVLGCARDQVRDVLEAVRLRSDLAHPVEVRGGVLLRERVGAQARELLAVCGAGWIEETRQPTSSCSLMQ